MTDGFTDAEFVTLAVAMLVVGVGVVLDEPLLIGAVFIGEGIFLCYRSVIRFRDLEGIGIG